MKRRLLMTMATLAWVGVAGCGGSQPVDSARSQDSTGDTAEEETGGDPGDLGGDGVTTTAGGESPPPGEPMPMVAASEEWNALLDADADLDESLELARPDCGAAGEHIERLCELAERICEIADDTNDPGAGDRCADGTARCERGRSAYADACD